MAHYNEKRTDKLVLDKALSSAHQFQLFNCSFSLLRHNAVCHHVYKTNMLYASRMIAWYKFSASSHTTPCQWPATCHATSPLSCHITVASEDSDITYSFSGNTHHAAPHFRHCDKKLFLPRFSTVSELTRSESPILQPCSGCKEVLITVCVFVYFAWSGNFCHSI